MDKKYVIKGIGEPFDGLIVHCDINGMISRIEKKHQLFESFSIPIDRGLHIDMDRLVMCKDDEEEPAFQDDNPFGDYSSTFDWSTCGYSITCSVYEKASTIIVFYDANRVYTQNFFGKKKDTAMELVHNTYNEKSSIEDFIFDLNALHKGTETRDGEEERD